MSEKLFAFVDSGEEVKNVKVEEDERALMKRTEYDSVLLLGGAVRAETAAHILEMSYYKKQMQWLYKLHAEQ